MVRIKGERGRDGRIRPLKLIYPLLENDGFNYSMSYEYDQAYEFKPYVDGVSNVVGNQLVFAFDTEHSEESRRLLDLLRNNNLIESDLVVDEENQGYFREILQKGCYTEGVDEYGQLIYKLDDGTILTERSLEKIDSEGKE